MWAQNNKWQTSSQNHFHGNPLNIFAKDLELFLLQNELFFNAYLICLIFTQGSTIKRIVRVGRSISGRVQSGGATSDGKIHFPLMTKGERFIRCKGKCLEKEHRDMVLGGAMVTGGA